MAKIAQSILSGLISLAIIFTLSHPLPSLGSLVCDQPIFDFGTVQTGEQITHIFKLRNAGDATILITDIDSPCGCMESSKPENAIAPGEEVEFPVVLDLQGRSGAQNRRMFLRANHELQPSVVLTMRGHAAEGLRVQPAVLVLHKGQAGELWQGKVTVSSPDKQPFEILAIQANNPAWNFEQDPLPNTEGNQIRVHRQDAPPPGQERSVVKIRTNHPMFPEAEFQILTVSPAGLIFTPEKLEFPEQMGAEETASILIRDPDGGDLEILHVELPQDGMSWEVVASANGLIQLEVAGVHPVDSLNKQKLKIHFASAGELTIEIPFVIRANTKGGEAE